MDAMPIMFKALHLLVDEIEQCDPSPVNVREKHEESINKQKDDIKKASTLAYSTQSVVMPPFPTRVNISSLSHPSL